MAWALLHKNNTAATTTSLAFGTNPTAGNLLLIIPMNSAGVTTFTAVSDTYGNAWTSLGGYAPATGLTSGTQYWVCINKGGSGTNTVSWTGSATGAFAAEFTGAPASITQDGALIGASSASATGTVTTPTSPTPAVTGDLVINGGIAGGTATTWNSPWSNGDINANGNGWGWLVGTASAVAANWTESPTGGFASSIVMVEPAAAGGGSGPQQVFLPRHLAALRPGRWPQHQYGAPQPQQAPAGIWLPPTTFSAPRNRNFFVVRGRQSKPVSSQDIPSPSARTSGPRREPARQPRGRQAFPVQPQIPVPPTIPGNRIDSARSKIAAVRRGRQTNPILSAGAIITPTYIPQRIAPKRLVVVVAHTRRFVPTTSQDAPIPRTIAYRKQASSPTRGKRVVVADTPSQPLRATTSPRRMMVGSPTRGRRSSVNLGTHHWATRPVAFVRKIVAPLRGKRPLPVQPQTAIVAIWTPPKLGAPRRLLNGAQHGKQYTVTPAQVPVPKLSPANRAPTGRGRIAALRRGKRDDPPWIVTAPITPAFVPIPPHTRIRVGYLRRGRRIEPVWLRTFVAEICYPTMLFISGGDTSALTFAGYTSGITVKPYTSTALIAGYASSVSIRPYASSATVKGYTSTGAITGYSSSNTVVTYSSMIDLDTCGDARE